MSIHIPYLYIFNDKYISEIFNKYGKENVEIEIRFRKIFNDHNIMEKIRDFLKSQIQEIYEEYKTYYYNNDKRKNVYQNKSISQIKKNIKSEEQDYNDFNLKFSISQEININDIQEKYNLEKIRKRYSYKFPKYVYTITYDDSNNVEFEIEYENNIFLSKDSYKIVNESLTKIAKIFIEFAKNPTIFNIIPKKEQSNIITFYKNLKIREIRPINIKKDTKINKNFVVTNKLDGEHYIIFIYNRKIYILNNYKTVVECFFNIPYVEFDNVILVLDTEYFEKYFYVFDVLYVFDGYKIIKHKNVIEKMKYIYDIINNKLKLDWLICKQYYEIIDNDNENKNTKSLLSEIDLHLTKYIINGNFLKK
jgi:hypothetical protein